MTCPTPVPTAPAPRVPRPGADPLAPIRAALVEAEELARLLLHGTSGQDAPLAASTAATLATTLSGALEQLDDRVEAYIGPQAVEHTTAPEDGALAEHADGTGGLPIDLAGTLAHRARGIGVVVAAALGAGLAGREASAAVWALAAELRMLGRVVDNAARGPALAAA